MRPGLRGVSAFSQPREQVTPQVPIPRALVDLASGQRGGEPSEGYGGEAQEVCRLFGVHYFAVVGRPGALGDSLDEQLL